MALFHPIWIVLYLGASRASFSRLQLVRNSAAMLLTGTKKREHITFVLIKLHFITKCSYMFSKLCMAEPFL